jgi:hypothetical protein
MKMYRQLSRIRQYSAMHRSMQTVATAVLIVADVTYARKSFITEAFAVLFLEVTCPTSFSTHFKLNNLANYTVAECAD